MVSWLCCRGCWKGQQKGAKPQDLTTDFWSENGMCYPLCLPNPSQIVRSLFALPTTWELATRHQTTVLGQKGQPPHRARKQTSSFQWCSHHCCQTQHELEDERPPHATWWIQSLSSKARETAHFNVMKCSVLHHRSDESPHIFHPTLVFFIS